MDIEKILHGLNDAQKEAVMFSGAPQLVLAGAGSGKTRVLTSKVAWLIAHDHVFPRRILAVTFTNKAAREMKERVGRVLKGNSDDVQVSTFHSFGLNLMYRNRQALAAQGYSPEFVVYDRSNSQSVIKQILKDMNIDAQKVTPASILNEISSFKTIENPEKVEIPEYRSYVRDIFEKYNETLKEQGAFDFDDLLLVPLKLLRSDEELLAYERSRLSWILVDEYQDVNVLQYEMMRLLNGGSDNLMVVGDPDQSIYGWRGANYETIMNFDKDFPKAKVTLLEQNYRSTSTILRGANGLIHHNTYRRDKDLRTDRESGEKIHVRYMLNEREEAKLLAKDIRRLTLSGYSYKDIAVLYRVNTLSRIVEQTFIEERIPYKVLHGTSFYDRMEVRDAIAFMRLAVNPHDFVSLARVGNKPPRGLGAKSIEKLEAFIRECHGAAKDIWGAVKEKNGGLSGKAGEGAKTLAEHMLTILERSSSIVSVLEWVMKGMGYEAYLEENQPSDYEERIGNVLEIMSIAPDSDDLSQVLSQIALYTDMDMDNNESDSVSLLTLHAAKGLEFPVVFMIGMEENLFPHSRCIDNGTVEEERRLCYVGMTRAEELLYMSGAMERRQWGFVSHNGLSRFLAELPDDCTVEYEQKEVSGRNGYGGSRPYWGTGRR